MLPSKLSLRKRSTSCRFKTGIVLQTPGICTLERQQQQTCKRCTADQHKRPPTWLPDTYYMFMPPANHQSQPGSIMHVWVRSKLQLTVMDIYEKAPRLAQAATAQRGDMSGAPQCQQTRIYKTAMLAYLSKICSLLLIDLAQHLDGHRLHSASDPSIHLQENKERSTPWSSGMGSLCATAKAHSGSRLSGHDSLSLATGETVSGPHLK